MGEVMLNRRSVVTTILGHVEGRLVVAGLGSPTYDVAAAGDGDRNFYLWGAMGGACMVGLGLALAQPGRRVLVVTGDGEMLMGLGSLATIAQRQPPNLTIVVLDNGLYGETGMQPSHTAGATSLAKVAWACGIPWVIDVTDGRGLTELLGALDTANETLFVRVQVAAEEVPRVLPTRDGVELKVRFRGALGLADKEYR
jgi:thiamine pyrophosphate-dependent acetolactate synthase large subunit-like protein